MSLDWISFGSEINFGVMIFRILAAAVLGAVIGIERETKNRPAGMRTHVLVCLGAAIISLVEQATISQVALLGSSHINVSVGRLTAAIVSGVGFLGAGTIITADRKISGLTTAASLWCTACLGLAVGAGFTLMATVACAVVMIVLKLMQKVVHVHASKTLEVQFVHRKTTLPFIKEQFAQRNVLILDQNFHAETLPDGGSLYTNVYTLTVPGKNGYQELIDVLSEQPNIRTVRTRNI